MPEVSPNQVYLRTQRGLSEIVSAAVASRVLNQALADAGVPAARVRPVQMKALLLGPVLDELELILPRSGLVRHLETLADSLDAVSVAAQQPQQPVRPAAAAAPARNTVPKAALTGVVTGVRTATASPGPVPAERLQAAVLSLAALDNVSLVAAVRAGGAVEFSRGSGDVAALARLGMLALSLLRRAGPLRMYFISSDSSSLLLFPWEGDALLLIGSADLNVGAAVATFNDIVRSKEEP